MMTGGLHTSPISDAIAKRVVESGPMGPALHLAGSCRFLQACAATVKVGPPNPTVQVMGPFWALIWGTRQTGQR